MKMLKLMCLIIVFLGLIPASSVLARGGHHFGHHHHGWGGFGLGLGLGYGLGYGYRGFGGYGLGYPGYRFGYGGYYPPYYAYPPVVAIPSTPPVYIEKQQSAERSATKSQSNYWHYCRNPEGYYPYVKKCPDGWLPVAPQPTAQ